MSSPWGGGGGGGNSGILLVRMCESEFGNQPQSYTWPFFYIKKTAYSYT